MAALLCGSLSCATSREDDTNWPKKNIVGKQELEIRVGNDHIAFEVRVTYLLQTICLTVPFKTIDSKNRFPG
jgi:hypothetical protein